MNAFMTRLQSFMADTPYELIRDQKLHYQNVMFIVSKFLGFYVQAEHRTSQGHIDLLLQTDKFVYVIEFKLEGSAGEALRQIEDKHRCESLHHHLILLLVVKTHPLTVKHIVHPNPVAEINRPGHLVGQGRTQPAIIYLITGDNQNQRLPDIHPETVSTTETKRTQKLAHAIKEFSPIESSTGENLSLIRQIPAIYRLSGKSSLNLAMRRSGQSPTGSIGVRKHRCMPGISWQRMAPMRVLLS